MGVGRLFPRSGLFKYLDGGGVAKVCRTHQGCQAMLILRMHIRAGGQQGLDGVAVNDADDLDYR